jgi:hypothetical protein
MIGWLIVAAPEVIALVFMVAVLTVERWGGEW